MFVDLRQPFYMGMPYIQAAGGPQIDFRRVQRPSDEGSGLIVRVTDFGFNTHLGTHVDVPSHVLDDGKRLEDFEVGAFVGPGCVIPVEVEPLEPIEANKLERAGIRIVEGDIVLVHTSWSTKYGTPEYYDHPFLAQSAVEWLLDRQIKIVGIDTLSPDMPDRRRPIGYGMPMHRLLLEQDCLIIENVGDLSPISGSRARIAAVPILIDGADGAPTSLFAETE